MFEAIGLLEFTSIARGIEACDAMAKASEALVIKAHPICAGKFLVLIAGCVADVQASVTAGEEIGRETIVDKLVIPNILLPKVYPSTIRIGH